LEFEIFIANRYLHSPRKDRSISVITGISILGVALGVATLIIVLSVMNGFEQDLKGALEGANPHLIIQSVVGTASEENLKPFYKLFNNNELVKGVAPFTTSQALIMGLDKPQGSLIRGIDPKLEPDITRMERYIRTTLYDENRQKDLTTEEQEREIANQILTKLTPHLETIIDKDNKAVKKKVSGIIIGSQLAKKLGVMIDDWVTVLSPEERITPMGNMPRAKKFKVVGFFESGLMGYDEILSYIDYRVAQQVFRMKGEVSGLSVGLKNGSRADQVKESIEDQIDFPYLVTTWAQQNKNLFVVIQLEKLGLTVILTLIIIIAAFNIISSLVMLVIEKHRDIAILKSLGASNRSIRKIFIIQGSVIGLTGTVIGETLGLLLCWLISAFDVIDIPPGVYVGNRIPIHIEFWQISLIAVISFLICFLVTIMPSQKAAKLDPVEGLRNG
jgi:lipoprotein-releasing system permease protein